jgi:hypothetical protein
MLSKRLFDLFRGQYQVQGWDRIAEPIHRSGTIVLHARGSFSWGCTNFAATSSKTRRYLKGGCIREDWLASVETNFAVLALEASGQYGSGVIVAPPDLLGSHLNFLEVAYALRCYHVHVTSLKCTGAASEPLKTATTGNNTVVLAADFYRQGDGNEESFTAKMVVSENDLAPEIPGVQTVWIQGVGCGTGIANFN